LNRRQSRLGRILHLSRVVRHGRFASPITRTCGPPERVLRSATAGA
jgi:hypothetical protein